MLEQYVCGPCALARVLKNPILEHIERLVAHLHGQGYRPATIQRYVLVAEHFGNWLGRRPRRLRIVSRAAVDAFLHRHLPRCSCSTPAPRHDHNIRRALAHMVPPPPAAPPTPSERLVQKYLHHLDHVCGAAPATLFCRGRYAREFLGLQSARGARCPSEWTVRHVMQYVLKYFTSGKRSTARSAAYSLRSFLRFLHARGLCDSRLINAVPRLPLRRRASLPRVMTEEQLRRFLASFDRSDPIGRRDYAMALFMVELGLRVGEVVSLELRDIDWRTGTVAVRSSKGRRTRLLPLSARIGSATADYIKGGRPVSQDRHVFLRQSPPVGSPVTGPLIKKRICRAYARSGCPADWAGTHVLRHTAATRLLRGGACMKEIADVLGHRSIETSAIYATVDVAALSAVALPWPEARP